MHCHQWIWCDTSASDRGMTSPDFLRKNSLLIQIRLKCESSFSRLSCNNTTIVKNNNKKKSVIHNNLRLLFAHVRTVIGGQSQLCWPVPCPFSPWDPDSWSCERASKRWWNRAMTPNASTWKLVYHSCSQSVGRMLSSVSGKDKSLFSTGRHCQSHSGEDREVI